MRTLLRIAEGVCLMWWIFAAAITATVTTRLPRLAFNADVEGCYRSLDWVEYVECGQGGLQGMLGAVLTLALFWTKDVEVLFTLLIIPLGIVWLVSLYLAVSCLFGIVMRLKAQIFTRRHY